MKNKTLNILTLVITFVVIAFIMSAVVPLMRQAKDILNSDSSSVSSVDSSTSLGKSTVNSKNSSGSSVGSVDSSSSEVSSEDLTYFGIIDNDGSQKTVSVLKSDDKWALHTDIYSEFGVAGTYNADKNAYFIDSRSGGDYWCLVNAYTYKVVQLDTDSIEPTVYALKTFDGLTSIESNYVHFTVNDKFFSVDKGEADFETSFYTLGTGFWYDDEAYGWYKIGDSDTTKYQFVYYADEVAVTVNYYSDVIQHLKYYFVEA